MAQNMIKYFHELTDDEFNELKESGINLGELAVKYPQPDWCDYPDALLGVMGCWSLVYRCGVSESYCKECDCFNAH